MNDGGRFFAFVFLGKLFIVPLQALKSSHLFVDRIGVALARRLTVDLAGLPSLFRSDIAPILWFTTSGDTHHGKLFKVVLATFTFLLFFYSATIAMSFMYGLDSALIGF